MKRWTLALAAAIFVVSSAGACGSDDKNDSASDATTTTASDSASPGVTSAGTGENAHACDLLTPADIDSALHVAVTAGPKEPDESVTVCTFANADRSTIVNLFRYENGGDLLKNIRAADPKATTASGIGDDAVVQPHIGSIATTIGSIGIKIDAGSPAESAVLEQLAKASVDHFNNP